MKRRTIMRRGFTLIELLVVISIIVLLMAILLPALQRIRRQGKAVACQSNLRQWGVTFSMYVNDNRGALPPLMMTLGPHVWPQELRTYCTDSNDLLLCPMASRWEIRADNPYPIPDSASLVRRLRVVGSKSTAWEYRLTVGPFVRVDLSGSYGINTRVRRFHMNRRYPGSTRNNIPVLLDCVYLEAWPGPRLFDDPPEYEGQIERRGDMKHFCINRHDGGINGLFLDWSVRKVGLKELWMLRWHPALGARWLAQSPWTKVGGVQPEDWPLWMRKFKDY